MQDLRIIGAIFLKVWHWRESSIFRRVALAKFNLAFETFRPYGPLRRRNPTSSLTFIIIPISDSNTR